jgi:ribosomal protein S18 acetylase RimI-like enzyme
LAQQRKIEVITTHADNTAIGFYEKMGFSVRELVEKSELGEKKFSDSTVMQTAIDKNIDYFAMRGFLKRQRQLLTRELHNGS